MDWIRTRFVILSVVLVGAGILALAQEHAEFAYLNLRTSTGETLSLKTDPARVKASTRTLRFVGGGAEVLIQLPAGAQPGSTSPVPVQIDRDGHIAHGTLAFDVEETGRFLSGTLHGAVGAWGINGGVRLHAAAPVDLDHRQVATRR